MIYDLAGLARIGDEVTPSAFLIPYFRSRTSNQVFAQDLDEHHRISRFLIFDPFKYTTITTALPTLSRAVGDLGVMAYVRRESAPIVGDARDIVASLRSASLVGDRSPFFEIDAYGLTGQKNRIHGALRRARRALGDGPIAARWSATETVLLRRLRAAPVAEPDTWYGEIENLASDFEQRNWTKRWIGLWSMAALRERLTELGVDFLERSGQAVTMKGRILSTLVRLPPDLVPGRLWQLADDWLVECARVQPINATLPKIWKIVALREDPLSDQMTERGLAYLRDCVSAGRVTAVWASVASTLRQRRAHDHKVADEIFDLARAVLAHGAMPTIALRPVIKSLLADPTDRRAINVLADWVTLNPSHSNAWIDAFLAVLEVRGGEPALLEAGMGWLERDAGGLRRWKQVYAALAERLGPSDELHEIARNWLLRANRRMLTWPEVAIDVLSWDNDPVVEAAAREWLEGNRLNPLALTLEPLLLNYTISPS